MPVTHSSNNRTRLELDMNTALPNELPGLDCGVCGYRSCEELAARLETEPDQIKRCIHLSEKRIRSNPPNRVCEERACEAASSAACSACGKDSAPSPDSPPFIDSLGRDFDFYLEHFPEDPGPREIIIPHNPMITRELEVAVGDILIGRPLGMSCGCPVTHCGVATQVDRRTGVMTWCVTGPLGPRAKGFKDLGYYTAEGYEGLVKQTRVEPRIGARHFFQPRMCMLQWRHSGLINYLNRTTDGLQVRLEGLFIG
jgi:uncharacterized Fe-S cluster-containing protein